MAEDNETWLTDEIRQLLDAISGQHVERKRHTLMVLALATVNGEPLTKYLDKPETCQEKVWHLKWKRDPAVKAAFDACVSRLLAWRDEETAQAIARAQNEFKREVAKYVVNVPVAFNAIMVSPGERGADKINAGMKLVGLFDPTIGNSALASPVGGGVNVEQSNVNAGNVNVGELSDADLDARIRELVGGGGDVAGRDVTGRDVTGRDVTCNVSTAGGQGAAGDATGGAAEAPAGDGAPASAEQ